MGRRMPREERRRLTRALVPWLRSVCGLSTRRAEQVAPYFVQTIERSAWLAKHDERVRAEGRR